MRGLRVLFIAPYRPSLLRVRPFTMLRALASRHRIDIIALSGDDPTACLSLPGETHSRSLVDRLLSARRLVDQQFPLQCLRASCRSLAQAVSRALAEGVYDLIHVEHLRAVQFIPDGNTLPIVFDAVDCISDLFIHAANHQGPVMSRVYRLEAARLTRYEAHALSAARQVLVSARRDMAALQRINPEASIAVVPNVVDTERFAPGRRRAGQVVFAGRMSYHANRVAAEWLCDEIWPTVRKRHPEGRLVIAGSGPPAALVRRARPDVVVTGYVPDLAALVRSSSVALAPLRYAVGMQNKVLEAMASGTPIVATSIAVEDMPLENGRQVLVADDAENFADGVCRLLEDERLASSMGAAGRDYVLANHSAEPIAELVSQHYDAAATALRQRRS